MALLEDCFFCSLSVAASVIGVYTLVAYVIAFFIETWWIVNTPVSLPSPAYVLCAGYLIVSVFSGILLRGLSVKNSLFLLEWLLVVAALSVPEGVLVYFMSIHYWNIRSLYGLMELTCWICRAIVNVSGMICVQSLYSNWREEKEVLRRLRDLNMTRVMPIRRPSVGTHSQMNGYGKGPGGTPPPPPPQQLNNGAFIPTMRRTSVVSLPPRPQTPALFMGPPSALPVHPFLAGNPSMAIPFQNSEFDASQFNLTLISNLQNGNVATRPPLQVSKSHSMLDLRTTESLSDIPRKTVSVMDFPVNKRAVYTQSLDRRILKSGSNRSLPPYLEPFYGAGRLQSAYFPPSCDLSSSIDPSLECMRGSSLVYRSDINSFYPRKSPSRSKHSVGSDSDDFQKYRDIAL